MCCCDVDLPPPDPLPPDLLPVGLPQNFALFVSLWGSSPSCGLGGARHPALTLEPAAHPPPAKQKQYKRCLCEGVAGLHGRCVVGRPAGLRVQGSGFRVQGSGFSIGWTTLRRTALLWTAQNVALSFPSPALISFFFCLSGCLLVEFWWCFLKA